MLFEEARHGIGGDMRFAAPAASAPGLLDQQQSEELQFDGEMIGQIGIGWRKTEAEGRVKTVQVRQFHFAPGEAARIAKGRFVQAHRTAGGEQTQ